MSQTQVVVAIIKENNKYLIVQRNKNKHLGLMWEFPRGKVKSDESLEESLIREIKEEVNIIISVQEKIAEEWYKDHKIDIHLYYFLCTQVTRTIELVEHKNIAWVTKKDFGKYEFVEGDGNILSLL